MFDRRTRVKKAYRIYIDSSAEAQEVTWEKGMMAIGAAMMIISAVGFILLAIITGGTFK